MLARRSHRVIIVDVHCEANAEAVLLFVLVFAVSLTAGQRVGSGRGTRVWTGEGIAASMPVSVPRL